MKSKVFFTISIFLFILNTLGIFAQETENPYIEADQIDDTEKLFFIFHEGAAASWLTRIVKQTERSNFVFKDFLMGLYFKTELHNLKIITPMIRIAAYYPTISSFNDFPQKSRTPLHFGFDATAGLIFNVLEFNYFRLNACPAIHFFFLNADRWDYFNMGAAGFLEFQLPLTERWTFICNGAASIDNGNLGGNRLMEPFDVAWQYQVDIGVRYSKKLTNGTYLIPRKGGMKNSWSINR